MEAARQIARPLSEWHEDIGCALWWFFPMTEAPYVGSPLDCGRTCEVTLRLVGEKHVHRVSIGGWPGYHTHWTPLPPIPLDPTAHQEADAMQGGDRNG